MHKQTIYAIANQKGGVGKTTIALNLAAGLSRIVGDSVLLIDLDPQSNSSTNLLGPDEPERTVYDFLMDGAPFESVVQHAGERLDVLPSAIDLVECEIKLMGQIGGQLRLRSRLQSSDLSKYDSIIIDTPPNLSYLVINALAACNEVLIPVVPGKYSFKGLRELAATIDQVRTGLANPGLHICGVIVNMVDHSRIGENARAEIAEQFKGRVFTNCVPRSVRFEEAHRQTGGSIFTHAAHSPAAEAMGALVQEIADHEQA